MSTRLPVTLLGGYLGAGKTTILNRLLAATDRRLVVLVNDVGAIEVDAALVADHDGQTFTLTNGCVCCSIADGLGPTLERVRLLVDQPHPPEQMVIEMSGIAEPARVAPWATTTGFRLDGIVVAADADQIVELAGRPFVGATIRTQLAAADLILLTKLDLVDDGCAAARAFVAEVGGSPVHDARAVGPDVVFGSIFNSFFGVGGDEPPEGVEPTGHHVVSTLATAGLDRAGLESLVDRLPEHVVRAKGLVHCVDVGPPIEVHVVGRRRQLRERPDLSERPCTEGLVVISVDDRSPS